MLHLNTVEKAEIPNSCNWNIFLGLLLKIAFHFCLLD